MIKNRKIAQFMSNFGLAGKESGAIDVLQKILVEILECRCTVQ